MRPRKVPPRAPKRETPYTFGFGDEGEVATCWLRQFADDECGGRLEKAHLLRQQTIRRELKNREGIEDLRAIIWDPRVWRPACNRHHTSFDAKRLRIPREAIPEDTERFAREWGLDWWLDRNYQRTEAAA